MLLDTDAERQFLVFLSPIHLALQTISIDEDGIIPHVPFPQAWKIQNSQLRIPTQYWDLFPFPQAVKKC